MVSVEQRVFFVAGTEYFQRQRAIESIKARILKNKASSLNTLIFYSKEIDIKDLEEKIFTFSFDKEKIIIFKNAYNLSKEVKDFLFKNLEKIIVANYIILEIEKDFYLLREDRKVADEFFRLIFKTATGFKVSSSPRGICLEDFRRSIRRKDYSSSLYILEKLFEGGVKDNEVGPQILGMIVKEFPLSHPLKKKEYFRYLWETDRAIKEKGLSSRLAIEVLVGKLSLL